MISVVGPLQNLLVHSGAQQTCLIGMQCHLDDPVVQKCGCRALRALSADSDECKWTLKHCGGFDAMVRILKWLEPCNNSGISGTLIEEAVSVIACLRNIGQIGWCLECLCISLLLL